MSGNKAQMEQILQRHNKYRCMHQVPLMTWDAAIAGNAQSWADSTGGEMKHSSSGSRKNIGSFGYLGENLAWGVTDAGAVDMWYKEIDETNGGLISSFSSGTGHYTQVVWKGSTSLGCGVKKTLIVCQYGEGGNMAGAFDDNVLAPAKECSDSGSITGDVTTGGAGGGLSGLLIVVICLCAFVCCLCCLCACAAVVHSRKKSEGRLAGITGSPKIRTELAAEVAAHNEHPVQAVVNDVSDFAHELADPKEAFKDVKYAADENAKDLAFAAHHPVEAGKVVVEDVVWGGHAVIDEIVFKEKKMAAAISSHVNTSKKSRGISKKPRLVT